jgi:hypothetical protein
MPEADTVCKKDSEMEFQLKKKKTYYSASFSVTSREHQF